MRKVYRNFKTGVILADSFGSQWYTLNKVDALLFDPGIIILLENRDYDKIERGVMIEDHCDRVHGERPYWGDSTDLRVEWLPTGTKFRVDFKDGWEQIVILPPEDYKVFKA